MALRSASALLDSPGSPGRSRVRRTEWHSVTRLSTLHDGLRLAVGRLTVAARVHEVLVSSEDGVTGTAKVRLAQTHHGSVSSTARTRVRRAGRAWLSSLGYSMPSALATATSAPSARTANASASQSRQKAMPGSCQRGRAAKSLRIVQLRRRRCSRVSAPAAIGRALVSGRLAGGRIRHPVLS